MSLADFYTTFIANFNIQYIWKCPCMDTDKEKKVNETWTQFPETFSHY